MVTDARDLLPLEELGGEPTRSWLELPDPGWDAEEEPDGPSTVYRFDLTWLTSSWTCIFGTGCPGIDAAQPDAGCCVHGAWFSEPADEARVAAAVARLDASTWADHDRSSPQGAWVVQEHDGARRTARTDGACTFHNPRGFSGGYGCALHGLALREGRAPLELKPDVCWQLPVRRTYDEVTRPDGTTFLQVTVTEYDRRGWGEGGADLDWYCTTSPAAHTGASPVWVSLADELVELVGAEVYAVLAGHCGGADPSGAAAAARAPSGRRMLPLTVVEHPATAAAREHLAGGPGGLHGDPAGHAHR